MHLTFQKTYYTCVLNALLLYHSKLHPPNITKQNKSHYEIKSHTSVFNSLTVTRKVSLAGVGSDLISPTILSKTHRRDTLRVKIKSRRGLVPGYGLGWDSKEHDFIFLLVSSIILNKFSQIMSTSILLQSFVELIYKYFHETDTQY